MTMIDEREQVAENAPGHEGFEPVIVAFCCQYCAYAAADLAGSMRLQYSPHVRVVRLLCTGKTDPIFFLRAFEGGADGVFVAGCLEGNCHFVEGNLRAKKRVSHAKSLLDEVGIGGERLDMYNMSAGEGAKFAAAADEMTERIRALGPSPLRPESDAAHEALQATLDAVEATKT